MFTVKFDIGDEQDLLQALNLQSGGKVQQVIDKAVIDLSLPYCPWDTGTLARSPYIASEIGQGQVIYSGPQARYLYYGAVYGPNIPIFEDDSGEPTGWWSPPGKKKHPTGKKLTYNTDTNPLAGPFWVDRMKADHLKDIIEEAKSVVGAR